MSLGAATGQVAVGTLNGSVFIINVRNGHILRNAQVHQAPINGIAIQPGGKLLLSGGDDNNVILSDISTMEALFTLPAHKDRVLDVQFSGSGECFTTCSADRRVILWASPRQQQPAEEEEDEKEAPAIVPKTPPVPEQPPPAEKEEVTPDRNASVESVKKPEDATPTANWPKSLLEISDEDSSETSLPEETPVRGRMRTFVSSIRETPAQKKADSSIDTELADLIMQAGERLARIGTKLVDLGIVAKQLDEKITRLELDVRPRKPTPARRAGAK
jgi:hypothetical protein